MSVNFTCQLGERTLYFFLLSVVVFLVLTVTFVSFVFFCAFIFCYFFFTKFKNQNEINIKLCDFCDVSVYTVWSIESSCFVVKQCIFHHPRRKKIEKKRERQYINEVFVCFVYNCYAVFHSILRPIQQIIPHFFN